MWAGSVVAAGLIAVVAEDAITRREIIAFQLPDERSFGFFAVFLAATVYVVKAKEFKYPTSKVLEEWVFGECMGHTWNSSKPRSDLLGQYPFSEQP